MGNDILSVVFLALICIVIAGIVHKIAPEGMMMPTFALIAVCLWVAYDYILLRRYKAKAACSASKQTPIVHKYVVNEPAMSDLDIKIINLEESLGPEKPSKPHSLENDQYKDDIKKPQAKHVNEFDIGMYDRKLSVSELHKDMGCSGDTRMANRMKYMGLQSRMATDIHSRLNSEKLRPFFEEEMNDNEKAEWWNVENDYLDNFM